ncbi:MAG: SRPBCC family protein [Bacteroidetes bacterium]|nr:SRPBCC family protein [Bacteroidota bacterium]
MRNIVIILMVFASTIIFAQDSLRKIIVNERKIRTYERTIEISGSPDSVFAFMDDIRNTGKHMTENSNAMMGSKLGLHWLSDHKTGLGTKYRWTGKVVGMKMDFTVEVNKWIDGKEKEWGTVGDAKMIVIDWFEMYLVVTPNDKGTTNTKLGIFYTKHRGLWGLLFGKWYSKWCVKSMLKDTKKHFKNYEKTEQH